MGEFLTGEAARQRWAVLLDQVDAVHQQMRELSSDEVGNAFRVDMADRLETQNRTNRGLMYRVFGQIADPPDETAMVPETRHRLGARLRIPTREVTRRFKMAARFRPRRQLAGPPLPPPLPVVAAAVAAGTLGEDHLRAITTVLDLQHIYAGHAENVHAAIADRFDATAEESPPPPVLLIPRPQPPGCAAPPDPTR